MKEPNMTLLAEGKCPYCGADDCGGEDQEFNGDIAIEYGYCMICGAEWKTVFKASFIETIEKPEETSA